MNIQSKKITHGFSNMSYSFYSKFITNKQDLPKDYLDE